MELLKLVLFLVIVLGLIHYYLTIKRICSTTLDYFTFKGDPKEKTILIIGGTHGNEPAGTVAIKKLINDLNMKRFVTKYNLILVPYVNYCGIKLNTRHLYLLNDDNREYHIFNTTHPINKKIIKLVNRSDFVLDFHEGWGFFREFKSSIGNTISPTNTPESIRIANLFYNSVNDIIKYPIQKFAILIDNKKLIKSKPDKYFSNTNIIGSLRNYCDLIKKNYILIETAGQNDVQDLSVRVHHNRVFIDSLLK